MRRVRIAISACLLAAACADIQPSDPDAEPTLDAGGDEETPFRDAGDTPGADADPAAPDAGPGDELTRTFGAADIVDTYLRLNNPTFNYGGGDRMCADTTTDDRRILLHIDVSSLAAGVEVTGAALHVWTGGLTNDLSTQIYSVHPMLEEWKEGIQTGAAGNASWELRLPATPWTTAGAGTGSRAADAVGSFVPDAIDTEYTVELEPALVQGWVDDATTNHGGQIVSAGAAGGCFLTTEHAPAARRPSLVVTYR